MLGLRRGRPGAHPGARAGLRQVDRGVAAEVVAMAVRWHPSLVRAPAQLGRLHALRAEALHRPGVDEHALRLGLARALGVALGDVDALDAGLLHQPRPVLAGLRLVHLEPGVGGDVQERLLDQPRHHAGIGPAGADGGDAAGPAPAHVEHGLAQRVVRALRDRRGLAGVEAGPRLADRVDVEGVDVLAEVDQVGRAGVHRQVDDQAAAGAGLEQRRENLPVVLLRDRDLHMAQLALVQQRTVGVDRIDYRELRGVERDVALQQRQDAATDRAKTDQHDGTIEAGVDGPDG